MICARELFCLSTSFLFFAYPSSRSFMAAADALISAAGLVKSNTKLLKKSTATERATPTFKSTATERATSSTNHRLVKPNTKLLKKSTATERATPTSKSTATERATSSTDHVSFLPLTGVPKPTSKRQESTASVDGSGFGYIAIGDSDLEKIVALLLWMAQDFQSRDHRAMGNSFRSTGGQPCEPMGHNTECWECHNLRAPYTCIRCKHQFCDDCCFTTYRGNICDGCILPDDYVVAYLPRLCISLNPGLSATATEHGYIGLDC